MAYFHPAWLTAALTSRAWCVIVSCLQHSQDRFILKLIIFPWIWELTFPGARLLAQEGNLDVHCLHVLSTDFFISGLSACLVAPYHAHCELIQGELCRTMQKHENVENLPML